MMGRRLAGWAINGLTVFVIAYAGLLVQHNAYSQTGPIWCTPLVDCLGPSAKVGLDDWLNAKLYTEAWEFIRTTPNPIFASPVTLTAAQCTNHWHYSTNASPKTISLCASPPAGSTNIFSDLVGSVITIDGNGAMIHKGGGQQSQLVSSGSADDFCALIAVDATNWHALGCVGFN